MLSPQAPRRPHRLLFAALLLPFFVGSSARAQSLWQWARADNGGDNEYIRDIAVDTVNGYVYAVGAYDNAGLLGLFTSGIDGFLIKADLNGNIQWSQRIGSSGDDGAMGVAVGTDGNIYVTGYYSSSAFLTFPSVVPTTTAGGTDVFLACFTPSGGTAWVRTGGGSADDQGVSVAVNGSGAFIQALHKGQATFGGSTSTVLFSDNSHTHATLIKYSLAGALQWQVNGGSGSSGNKNVLPERISCDGDRVYITGSFSDPQMLWYSSGGALLQTITSAGGSLNGYVCAVSNTGAFVWGQSMSNPGSDNINANAIAAGCSGLYIAGSTHNNSIFPGGVTVSVAGAPHDHMYLAALDRSTGNTQWVRTAYGADHHLTVGYDLTVHRNGCVLLTGTFKGTATFTDGTTVSTTGGGGYDLDIFVARYTPYGQQDWATVVDGSHDNIPMALALDNQSGIYVGGQFVDELFMPPFSFSSGGNANFFVGKFTDSSLGYWPVNPTNWRAPAAMCSTAPAINLNATLYPMVQGYADAVITSSGVATPTNILNAPNGTTVAFSTNGQSVTVDLTDTIPTGSTYVVRWAKSSAVAGTAALTLETSTDNSTWTSVTAAPIITAVTSAYTNSVVQATTDTRYLRISKTAASAVAFRVDGIKFYTGSQTGGTWSGPGVSGNTFSPAGLSGAVNITYTVQCGNCSVRSTTRSINVTAPPVGGSLVSSTPGLQCSGANSGTLTLTGYTGSIIKWEVSTDNFSTSTSIVNTAPTLAFSGLVQTRSYRAVVGQGACGTAVSAPITVQVGDNAAPVVTCPAAMTAPVSGACSAAVNYSMPVATDNCGVALFGMSAGYASGSAFPLGTTTVTYVARDAVGNAGSCSFQVTVVDQSAPVLTCPGTVTVAGNASCQGNMPNLVAMASAIDECPGAVTITQSVAAGSPVSATTNVVLSATDSHGNTSTCTVTVTLQDGTLPVMNCPGDVVVQAPPAATGMSVSYMAPTATDNCGVPNVALISGQASGSFFTVGTHTITYRANDAAGNTTTCSFNVVVTPDQFPSIACPSDITRNNDANACGALVNYVAPIGTDNDAGAVTVQTDGTGYHSGSSFPVGSTLQQYSVTDVSGNVTTCSFSVNVIDIQSPTITCPANVNAYSTSALCAVNVGYAAPVATDNCTGVTLTRIAGMASGSPLAPGAHTIIYRATDAAGNNSTCSFIISVIDTVKPVIIGCPSGEVAPTSATSCTGIATWSAPVASDNCAGPSIAQISGGGSGTLFPMGPNSIVYTATDASGNQATCSFVVTIKDQTPPVILNCPTDTILYLAPGTCTASWTTPTLIGTDNCAMPTASGSVPASVYVSLPTGSPVPFDLEAGTIADLGAGSFTFTDTIADAAGNSAACTYTVTVADTIQPVIICPPNDTLAIDPVLCSVDMPSYLPATSDNCTVDSLWQMVGPIAGDPLSLSGTPYYTKWAVRDQSGNVSICVQFIEVIDADAPTVNCPLWDGYPIYLDGTCSVAFPDLRDSITVSDCQGWHNDMQPPAGTMFYTDTTFWMTMDIEDDAGNHVDNDHLIHIIGPTPSIDCPSDTLILIDPVTCDVDASGLIALVTASDGCSGTVTIWQSAGDDLSLPIDHDDHAVEFTAEDASGNQVTCAFNVHAEDVPPMITGLPDSISMNMNVGSCAALMPDLASLCTITENCSLPLDISQWPVAGEPVNADIWAHITATDSDPLSATDSVFIHVVDVTAPTITCPADLSVTAVPGSCAAIVAFSASATDNCSASPSITYSQAPGTSFTIGSHTITAIATDDSGNSSSCSFTLTVNAAPSPTLSYGAAAFCGDNGSISPTVTTPAGGAFSSATLGSALNTVSGSIDLSQLTASGSHTVTYSIAGACAQSATTSLQLSIPPHAGNAGALTICSTAPPAPLLIQLGPGAQAGGTWTDPGGAAFSGTYDPVTNIAGVYSYTLNGTAPCVNETKTVTVNKVNAPNAGTNGTLTVCSNGGLKDLMTHLDGSPSNGGAWSGPSPVVGNIYDPATMVPGVYTYTVSGVAPCANASADVTVTENASPNAAFSYTASPYCGTSGQANATFTGTTGGVFSSTAGLSLNTATGAVALGTSAPGTYTITYTIAASGACAAFSTTASITITAAPSASIAYNGSPYCSNQGSANVSLTGTSGGQFSSSPSGLDLNASSGQIDIGDSNTGTYAVIYNIGASGGCAAFTTTTTVTINRKPRAGSNGTLAICSDSSPAGLFASLGGSPDTGGSWSGPSPVVGGTYAPATMAPGNYTYTVAPPPGCTSSSAIVAVTETLMPAATISYAGSPYCDLGSANVTRTGTAGGSYASSAGLTIVPGTGSIDLDASVPGTYTVTYTIVPAGSCPQFQTTAPVTINAHSDAGGDASISLCSDLGSFDLATLLNGAQSGGMWKKDVNTTFSGVVDPGFYGSGTHVYRYLITGQVPCSADSALFTVTYVPAPRAGADGALTICSAGSAQSLVPQLGSGVTSGGAWTFAGAAHTADYDPTVDAPGIYTYTVPGTAPCSADSATITVSETIATVWYGDADNDAAGDLTVTITACAQPAGYVATNNDQCPSDPLKTAPGLCGCGTPDSDADGDGTVNCNDGCPNDPNKVAAGICGCGIADTDTDGDGTADCSDNCPLVTGQIGSACDDGNALTINDALNAACQCVGTAVACVVNGDCNDNNACTSDACVSNVCVYSPITTDTDGDGVADCADNCPLVPGQINSACDDGNALTINDALNAACQCVGTAVACVVNGDCNDNNVCTADTCVSNACVYSPITTDTDGDGVPNCSDNCPSVVGQINSTCDDGNALTINDALNAACQCVGTAVACVVNGDCNDNNVCTADACVSNACVYTPVTTDTDGDGMADCTDNCPLVPGQINSTCNDGNALTINDALNAACQCVGTAVACVVNGDCNDNNVCTSDACVSNVCVYSPITTDTDGDGVADCADNCPLVPGQINSTCDDGNALTINDALNAACQCVGTAVACVVNGDCNDNNACTADACVSNTCVYSPVTTDTDGDGVADCNDGCPNDASKIAPGTCGCGNPEPGAICNDGDPATGNDVYDASCNCAGQLIDCAGVVGGTSFAGAPCDDGNSNTGNDVYNASCVCVGQLVDCLGVPGGSTIAGSSCDDGITETGNDVYDASCNCVGQLIDCAGVVGGTSFAGSPCDDGNSATGNDQYDVNCNCAGLLMDCAGVVGGTSFAGSPCDDGNIATGNDRYDLNCICTGQFIDCLGVPGGTTVAGSTCDDGIAETGNDVYDASCNCAGQLIDCAGVVGGTSFAGSTCDDGNSATGNDQYDTSCNCAGQLIDCAGVVGGTSFAGSPCDDGNSDTGNDLYNASCVCVGQPIDCLGVPGGTTVAGSTCDDGIAETGNDVYDASCNCAGQLIDCAGVVGGTSFAGSPCDDGNSATGNDMYDASCNCAGQLIDCAGVVGGTSFAGSPCDDGNSDTGNDLYNASCVCVGQPIDCLGVPGGTTVAGSTCDDGIAETGNDVYDASCNCSGQLIDCAGVVGGTSFAGSPCDDGNSATGNDMYDASCNCAGQLIDCAGVVGGTSFAGSPCDDGNSDTGNDLYNASCVCAGQLIDCLGVPGGTTVAGSTCDDGIAETGNDVYDASCNCSGQLIDCAGVVGGTSFAGSPCDDGNSATGNDQYDANCICTGGTLDCLGVPGGSATAGAPCDDNDAITINDAWSAGCICSGVADTDGDSIPDPEDGCVGTFGETGSTCDDGDPETINDVIDGNCMCSGQWVDCAGVVGGTAGPGDPCDDLDPATEGDEYQVDCTCAGTPIVTCIPPTITSATSNSPICSGEMLQLSVITTGTPDLEFSWIGPGTYAPGSESAQVSVSDAAGTQYSIVVTNACGSAGANVVVQIDPLPDAGEDSTVTVPAGTPVNLNLLLSTDSTSGSFSSPSIVTASGTLTYPFIVGGNCGTDTAYITVNGTPSGYAGEDVDVPICSGTSALDLMAYLPGADQGGTWLNTDNEPVNMPVSISGDTIFTYYVNGDAATVTIAVAPLPDAGTSTSASLCAGDAPVNLLTLLGGGSGGTWSGPDVVANDLFDPATMHSGDYVYTVTDTCGSADATVSVNIIPMADASWNPPTVLCANSGPLDMNSLVTGEVGGAWSGNLSGSIYDPAGQSGSFTFEYTAGSGTCASTVSHTITVNPGPMADAGPDAQVCALSHTMEAVIDVVPGTWSTPGSPGGALITDINDPHALVTVPIEGVYPFVWTVGDGQCTAADTTVITFHDPGSPLWVDAGDDQSLDVFNTTTLAGATAPGASVAWSTVSGSGYFADPSDTTTLVTGLAVGENVFVLQASFADGCASASDTMVIVVNDIFIPQGYSPNGDGVNDQFRITGIQAFPGNTLKVFNRWGQEVIGRKGYTNDWDGKGDNGQALPDDTYFYVLNLTPERTYNGFVIIKR